jgi:hypothetical protein
LSSFALPPALALTERSPRRQQRRHPTAKIGHLSAVAFTNPQEARALMAGVLLGPLFIAMAGRHAV